MSYYMLILILSEWNKEEILQNQVKQSKTIDRLSVFVVMHFIFSKNSKQQRDRIKKIKQWKINSYSCLMNPIFVSAFASLVQIY